MEIDQLKYNVEIPEFKIRDQLSLSLEIMWYGEAN